MVPISAVRLAVLSLVIFSATSRAADSGNEKNAAAPAVATNSQHSVSLRLRLKPSVDATTGEQRGPDAAALAQTEEVLAKRASSLGMKSVIFTKQPPDQLTVKADGLSLEQAGSFRKEISYVAALDFRNVHPDSETLIPKIEAKQIILDPAWVILPVKPNNGAANSRKLMVSRVPEITGDQVASAYAAYNEEGWSVGLKFNEKAAVRFFEITNKMRPSLDRFAIVLDREILSAPTTMVQGGIAGGTCVISGRFTEGETRILVSALMNPLQNPVVIEEENVK